jgi:hypothetical protein
MLTTVILVGFLPIWLLTGETKPVYNFRVSKQEKIYQKKHKVLNKKKL